MQEMPVQSLGQEDTLKEEMTTQPTPLFFTGESRGQRSLVGYSLWGHKRGGHDLETQQQRVSKGGNNSALCLKMLNMFFYFFLFKWYTS